MIQDAILFTKDTAEFIADNLDDYPNVEELLEDYGHMLEATGTVVLARDVLEIGWRQVSYVVTQQMFYRLNPRIKITSDTFTEVRRF